ncbi:MAG: hypothetical protein WCL19_07495 [Verrucomicrobiota bacterium]
MNRNAQASDNSWETDAVWQLLDQAPPATAGPRFVDDTVRAMRLAVDEKPWWKRLFSPAPLAGLAAATAGLAFAIVSLTGPTSTATQESSQEIAIQEIAETETLIAAVDQLDDFSDTELATLIGF